ncbi:MAG: hypothetical protein ABSF43_04235 [Rectinemataceae bacterium]|jgi:hypothetical protein
MKRATIIVVLIAVVACALAAETSAFYPVRIDVVKVFSHSDGFRVIYRKGLSETAAVYLPARWFVSGGKGELIRANDDSYPYMTVFYKDGKFDHLRLYVLSDQKDQTWGILSPSEGVGKFDSEDLKLEF